MYSSFIKLLTGHYLMGVQLPAVVVWRCVCVCVWGVGGVGWWWGGGWVWGGGGGGVERELAAVQTVADGNTATQATSPSQSEQRRCTV